MVSFELTGESGSTIQVTESAGSLQVVLVLSKPVSTNVTIFVVATNITATGLQNVVCTSQLSFFHLYIIIAGKDFGHSQNYPVTFLTGSITQSVNIPIIDDNFYELNETFQLEINVSETAVATGVIDGCDPFAHGITVEITDDDNRKLYVC